MASFMIIQGPDKGRTFELTDGENGIGRQSQPITLTDGTASRRHAQVVRQNGEWVLEDLGAANGTFLNGEKVSHPTALRRGDQIRCGSSILVFSTITGSEPIAPVDLDENGRLVDAAIVATIPSSEDSVILPTPEAGAAAIDNLRILYDLSAEIGSFLKVDQLIRRVLDKIFELVQADRGYVLLIQESEGEGIELKLKAARTTPEGSEERAPISRTIINEVIYNEVGVLSSNAMSDKRFAAGKSVHDFGIRSALCVPIKGREKILGVIHVDCSVSDHTYTTEQLRLLTAIGFQAGLAIENVRLYETALQSERLAAVGEAVAVLSHHIKNILQALGAGIDVVEMGLKRDNLNKAKDGWPIVQRNLGRINELILNMLAFSKTRVPHWENLNISHVLKEVLDLTRPRADERKVALLSDLDDIPPIPADADGLNQAFLNLVQNALDAVEDDTGAVTVTCRFDAERQQVVVEVIDNGSGIEPDLLDDIFTPFYSAKGQKGTGLGLAVARKMVLEHHGTIEVASEPDEGATFTVKLPARRRQAAEDTSGPAR